jgi:hypothetical protein
MEENLKEPQAAVADGLQKRKIDRLRRLMIRHQ